MNHEGTDPCPNHHSRTNGGNKNGDSDTEDRVRARKQKRKEKHQAEKDATATKKKGRFSATDNVATEDALGVEEMESALQIARHPPKPSRSKQNQGQKTKRERQGKNSGDVIVSVIVKEERKVFCHWQCCDRRRSWC